MHTHAHTHTHTHAHTHTSTHNRNTHTHTQTHVLAAAAPLKRLESKPKNPAMRIGSVPSMGAHKRETTGWTCARVCVCVCVCGCWWGSNNKITHMHAHDCIHVCTRSHSQFQTYTRPPSVNLHVLQTTAHPETSLVTPPPT